MIDGDTAVFESTILIECLEERCPMRARLIPEDPSKPLEVRRMDRFFDHDVAGNR
ncbi:MAG: hypothetical protein GX614_11610 [Sandaracinaceae bacterium]|nr:hypothetical protein [Sandaracinaceae bacterium]